MKLRVLLFLFLILFKESKSQQINLSLEKAKTIANVFKRLNEQDSFDKCLILIDIRDKKITAGRGLAAHLEINDSLIDDTVALRLTTNMIKAEGRKKNLNVRSFEEVNFDNHYQVINSDLFSGGIDPRGKKLGYIEIRAPIDGWGWSEILIGDSTYFGEDYMRFQVPQINIPVFVYSWEEKKQISTLYLFRFQMKFVKGNFSIEFLERKIIGAN